MVSMRPACQAVLSISPPTFSSLQVCYYEGLIPVFCRSASKCTEGSAGAAGAEAEPTMAWRRWAAGLEGSRRSREGAAEGERWLQAGGSCRREGDCREGEECCRQEGCCGPEEGGQGKGEPCARRGCRTREEDSRQKAAVGRRGGHRRGTELRIGREGSRQRGGCSPRRG